ncbi:hypothetical protein ASPZODRAFT_61472 [Penicilliopsis zonata CBS 506.65]|uniref:CENP-V/GFA domain-containing protein n=1 Tax=Penicilliopsis zonata CBS 506.65 TaxID=1073090 RepID=A0A1L9SNI4_9EURO|nr:hypothetical protein ASPZODRAFT_61472 [Penicilliopsis zonata CBS 506.65]OJJ48671.1 hypothetical protein ASPZODRAFT_61472 [Penicilliopsis zonata CBS 506.65]
MTEFNGSCLCSGIQFSLQGEPQGVFACYCTDCSMNAGGPCQFTSRFSRSQLQVQDPQSLIKVFVITQGTDSGYPKEKHFCGTCGCTLWTVPRKHGGEVIVVRTSLIKDGLTRLPPRTEVFVRNKPEYFTGCSDIKSFDGMFT